MPEYQWLCWLTILMFLSSSRSTFCNTRPCRWLAMIMILSLAALKQDIAVQCCEDLKCRIRAGRESHFIGCWTVGKISNWFWGESSPHRQRCRDDCVNVKLFVKLFVITRAAGQRGRERRCRDGLRSHLGSDQAGSRGQSPESREEAVIITRVFTLLRVGMRLRLSLQGASLTRLPERTWFLCTGYYVFYRLFPCFGETQYCVSQWLCREALNNEKTWPMRRLDWAGWANERPRCSPNSLICPESILWAEPWPASLAGNQTSISSLPLSL